MLYLVGGALVEVNQAIIAFIGSGSGNSGRGDVGGSGGGSGDDSRGAVMLVVVLAAVV